MSILNLSYTGISINISIMVEVKNLCKSYYRASQKIPVLKNINFSLNRSKTLAVTGSSGSGKTTLLSLLAGLESPDKGDIFINNKNISTMNEPQRMEFRRQNVGIVFQQFHLMSHLTALENVSLPLEITGDTNVHQKALKQLEKVKLSHRLNHLPAQLSGGECQRVAIARASVNNPSLLLADEPTGNLDKQSAAEAMDLLFSLVKENKMTLILVTHNLSLASLCDHQINLENIEC